jgi:hypothetical protein
MLTALPVLHKYNFRKLLAQCVVVLESEVLTLKKPCRIAELLRVVDDFQLDTVHAKYMQQLEVLPVEVLADVVEQLVAAQDCVARPLLTGAASRQLAASTRRSAAAAARRIVLPPCTYEGGPGHLFGCRVTYSQCACPGPGSKHVRCYFCHYCPSCRKAT